VGPRLEVPAPFSKEETMTTGTYELSHAIVAPVPPPASAALGIRMLATAIDGVLIGATVTLSAAVMRLIAAILPSGVGATGPLGLAILGGVVLIGYFVYYWGVEGATPGKRMMGICVTRPRTLDAQIPIGVGRACLRLIGMAAGGIFLADLIFAFLHRDRRALHDLMADSIVVARR